MIFAKIKLVMGRNLRKVVSCSERQDLLRLTDRNRLLPIQVQSYLDCNINLQF
jgi:hypothetical protein